MQSKAKKLKILKNNYKMKEIWIRKNSKKLKHLREKKKWLKMKNNSYMALLKIKIKKLKILGYFVMILKIKSTNNKDQNRN